MCRLTWKVESVATDPIHTLMRPIVRRLRFCRDPVVWSKGGLVANRHRSPVAGRAAAGRLCDHLRNADICADAMKALKGGA